MILSLITCRLKTRVWQCIAAAGVLCLSVAGASADSVTLRGSSIPLRDVQIQAIRAGEVFFLDRSDRPVRRGLGEISRLGFDELPELDRAEQAIAEGDHDAALRLLLRALLGANDPTQRLWLHARLSRVHDFREEYVPAAGHAAAAMMLEPNAYWRLLEPTSAPVEPSYAQAVEADDLLREAARQVNDGTLQQAIDRMQRVVRPIRQRLEAQYNGPPIARGSTWSGIARSRIADSSFLQGDPANNEKGAAPASDPTPTQPSEAQEPPTAGDSNSPDNATVDQSPAPAPSIQQTDVDAADKAADEIDELLQAGEFAEALNRCEAAGRQAGEQNLARLLHQWGSALAGVGRPRDASVMFTRCAVLFAGTEFGLESLIETAKLYDSEYGRPDTRRRLLNRAIEQAELQGRTQLAERARQLLREPASGR